VLLVTGGLILFPHRYQQSTFSYALNLTECFAVGGITFDPGGAYGISFVGALPTNPTYFASSGYLFRNQP
jgi:hypothetical protein